MLSNILAVSVVALQGMAHGSTFLHKQLNQSSEVLLDDVFTKVALLNRLEDALGSEHRVAIESRAQKISPVLRDILTFLPKSERGALGSSAARYAIHRYFVKTHGWQVAGLVPVGGHHAWSSSSPVLALADQLPGHALDIFEQQLGNHGFDLHELAVLTATIENMVHGEAEGRLAATYKLLELDPAGSLSSEAASDVVDTYAQIYLTANMSTMDLQKVRRMKSTIEDDYPYWPGTQLMLRELQQELAPGATLSFSDLVKIVEGFSERVGARSDQECQDIQDKMVQIEEAGSTGRVKLQDFYASVEERGFWNFKEKPEYLRDMGAIDDSISSVPRVIISNYLHLQSNCLASSHFYSICCMDRCEPMMSHIEQKIGAPDATPEAIIELVSALPSASVSAPRALPTELVRRLHAVADHHGGVVPLHGRLFSQFMHFAYPRECVYPQATNTTSPLTEKEWELTMGTKSAFSKAQLQKHLAEAAEISPVASVGSASASTEAYPMWVLHEELVDEVAWKAAPKINLSRRLRNAFGTLCVAMLAYKLYLGLMNYLGMAEAMDPASSVKSGAQKTAGESMPSLFL